MDSGQWAVNSQRGDWSSEGGCATMVAIGGERRITMRKRSLIGAAFLIGLIAGAQGQQERLSVVLPASEAVSVAAEYPKSGPRSITGSWMPTQGDIDELETNLHQISELSRKGKFPGRQIEHPENYIRQYVGVLQDGQKRIYVNAFCGFNGGQPPQSPYWKNHLYIIYDGGSCVWRSMYDLSSKTFLELSINGVA